MNKIKVELEIPEDILLSAKIPKERLSEEIKKLFAFELYREGLISLGKACELAEITKWEFFEMNKRAKIPLHITEEDWERDKKTIKELTK
jgi:predicted HTH domain antitoxin